MKNYIKVKVTVWYRLRFDGLANMKGLAELVQESGLDEVIDEKLGFIDSQILHETQIRLTPGQNDNKPTILVYEDGKELWNNKAV